MQPGDFTHSATVKRSSGRETTSMETQAFARAPALLARLSLRSTAAVTLTVAGTDEDDQVVNEVYTVAEAGRDYAGMQTFKTFTGLTCAPEDASETLTLEIQTERGMLQETESTLGSALRCVLERGAKRTIQRPDGAILEYHDILTLESTETEPKPQDIVEIGSERWTVIEVVPIQRGSRAVEAYQLLAQPIKE